MANQVYDNDTDTNLKDLNNSNITDATAVAVPFLGSVGVNLTVDATPGKQTVNIASGETTVICAGTGTRTAFKLTDGVSMALVVAT